METFENQAFGHVRFNINILWIKSQKGKGYIFKIQWNLKYSGLESLSVYSHLSCASLQTL